MVRALSIKSNVLWNTFGCLFYQGCQWLLTVVVVLLSPNYENSGYLAFAMAVGNLYLGLATYNMRTYQVSDVENVNSAGNYVAFRFVTVSLTSLCFVLYAILVSSGETLVITLAYLLFKLDESFVNVMYGIDQKAYRMDYIGQSQLMRGTLCLGFFCLGLVCFDSLFIAIVGMAVACFCVTLFFDVPRARSITEIRPRLKWKQCRSFLVKCFPSAAAVFLCGTVVSLVRQVFGLQYGQEALGIYAAVATPAVVVQVLANYLYNPVLAPLAEKWMHGSATAFFRLLGKALFAMGVVIAVVLLVFGLFGGSLLVLVYGDSIAEYTYLLFPVLISTGCVAFMWFFTDLLISVRKLGGALAANVFATLFMLASMDFFLSNWYMNGINFCVISSYFVGLAAAILIFSKTAYERFKC